MLVEFEREHTRLLEWNEELEIISNSYVNLSHGAEIMNRKFKIYSGDSARQKNYVETWKAR